MLHAKEGELEILNREHALNNNHQLLGLDDDQLQKAEVANRANVAEMNVMESKCEMDIERIGSLRQEDSTLRCKPESVQNSWTMLRIN